MFKYFLLLLLPACAQAQSERIDDRILKDKNSFYYVDFAEYPKNNPSLPIGVFDSGTGGLTVLNAIVTFDAYNNQTGKPGKDGKPDFSKEDFIYLADQANMPYGNYPGVGKTDLLREHILKDAQFFLQNKYYENANGALKSDKKRVKALVIACNTATAYGKEYIEELLKAGGSDMKVIGVIDAGAEGALELFGKAESGAIGVFATAGTVASGGYVRAIERMKKEMGYTGDLQVYSQGGVGLAEAIDEDLSYIDKKAAAPRASYKGPNVNHANLNIDKTLMDIYNFDFSGRQMLCDASKVDDCSQLQINSAPNYVRYHLVSLLETMRKTPNARPLKALILGCTHYPYMKDAITQVLGELREYQKDGAFPYRSLLTEQVALIDPAYNTARELYEHLQERRLFSRKGRLKNAEFYISIPNPQAPGVQTEGDGARFTYDYKYGRYAGQETQYILNVPFSRQNISEDVAKRLEQQIPDVYRLIRYFNEKSDKTRFMQAGERL